MHPLQGSTIVVVTVVMLVMVGVHCIGQVVHEERNLRISSSVVQCGDFILAFLFFALPKKNCFDFIQSGMSNFLYRSSKQEVSMGTPVRSVIATPTTPLINAIGQGLGVIVGSLVIVYALVYLGMPITGASIGVLIVMFLSLAYTFAGIEARALLVERCMKVDKKSAFYAIFLSSFIFFLYPFVGLPLILISSLMYITGNCD